MPYATGGTFLDADSHIMELPDFLHRHADRWLLDALPPLSTASGGAQGEGASRYAVTKRHSAEQIAVLEQKRALVKGITQVVVETCSVPADAVVVTIHENPLTDKGKGGVLFADR